MPSRKLKHAPLAQLEAELECGLYLACHHMKEYVRSGADFRAYLGDISGGTEKGGILPLQRGLMAKLVNVVQSAISSIYDHCKWCVRVAGISQRCSCFVADPCNISDF